MLTASRKFTLKKLVTLCHIVSLGWVQLVGTYGVGVIRYNEVCVCVCVCACVYVCVCTCGNNKQSGHPIHLRLICHAVVDA